MTATPPSSPIPDPPSGGGARLLWWIGTAEPRFLLHRPGPGPLGRAASALQCLLLAARRYREDHAGDRAAALAFTTLLSLVPLLLLALAVLGVIGVSPSAMDTVERWLLSHMVPETARDVEATILSTVESLRTASAGLGLAGVLSLFPVAWKLLGTLDRTFQKIAGATTLVARIRRFAGFWMTVAVAPFLVMVSLLLSAIIESLAGRGLVPGEGTLALLRYLVPLTPGWLGLIIAYRFCAGTPIRWRAAVLGGTAGAVLIEILKVGFAVYLRHALVTRTVLTGMGVLPLFLLWIYLTWVMFLAGAELTLAADDYDACLGRSGLRREPEPGSEPAPGPAPPAP